MNFLLETLRLGLSNLGLHKLRSLLTAMGIIFGVAAVITMVAIGEGNKRRAFADIEALGASNIIVRSIKPAEPGQSGGGNAARGGGMRNMMIDYGIKRSDLRRIEASVGPLDRIVPLKNVGNKVTRLQYQCPAAVMGTTEQLVDVTSLRIERGRYLTAADMEHVDNVAVLGSAVADRLFPMDDPLAGTVRVGNQVFKVVGVLAPVGLAGGSGSALVGRDLNFDVHIPLTTAIGRFGDVNIQMGSGSMSASKVELSELYLEVAGQNNVPAVADAVNLILQQEHAKDGDVTVVVPLELLEQAERTQRMFNTLLIAIASISLLVGGIGIMNIMLASVTERTREIGIRRALGATRRHIISQFLVETTVLSGVGGVIGVLLGLAAVLGIAVYVRFFVHGGAEPQVTLWSIVVSFFVAAAVGVIFGLYPAVQAARQDPIVALRHD